MSRQQQQKMSTPPPRSVARPAARSAARAAVPGGVPGGVPQFNWSALTIDEVEMIEERLGIQIDQVETVGRGKQAHAVAWILRRKNEPDLTWEAAGATSMAEVEKLVLSQESGVPPTVAAG